MLAEELNRIVRLFDGSSSVRSAKQKIIITIMQTRYIIGGIIAVVFVAIGFYALNDSGIQYTDIKTAEVLNKKVQVKGKWLKEEPKSYDSKANVFTFLMEDDAHNKVKVEYTGAQPNNFELAESVVVKGKMENGVFHASDILTKCPSKYEGSDPNLHPGNKKSI
ncbi:MAG: cytochrome c maturation protein CcmE [Candidatus Kapaibacterium sp.]|nr:cytochrome c maturation protein CcmE [Bacteroidota bacterium]